MHTIRLAMLLIAVAVAAPSKEPKIKKVKPPKAQTYKTPKFKNSSNKPSTRAVPRYEQDKTAFRKQNPCPANGKTSGNCPGYVLDHTINITDDGQEPKVTLAWRPK